MYQQSSGLRETKMKEKKTLQALHLHTTPQSRTEVVGVDGGCTKLRSVS